MPTINPREVPTDADKFVATTWTVVKPTPVSLGGEGSGNFGHAGRPGEVGGSGPGHGYPSSATVQGWGHKAGVVTAVGDETSTGTPEIGKPFIVYRLGAKDGGTQGLENANAGNAEGVAEHLARIADFEAPKFKGGSGDHVTAYRVTIREPFGDYGRLAEGKALDPDHPTSPSVGRSAKPYPSHAGRGEVVYAFPKGSAWEAEVVASIPLKDIEAHLEATTGHRDMDESGTLKGAAALREVFAAQQPKDLGGAGSGNFGHAGRPGEVGGSAPGDRAAALEETRTGETASVIAAQAAAYPHNKTTHAEVHGRIAALVPSVYISESKQTAITAASHVADVLENLASRGYQMPDHVEVVVSEIPSIRARIRTKGAGEFKGQRWMEVHIPASLPEDANLDDAAAATYTGTRHAVDIVTKMVDTMTGMRKGKVSVKSEKEYDRFAVRNMNEVVIHEMGHIQAGHRGKAYVKDTKGAMKSKAQMVEAMRSVSLYASTSQDEFMAESFVRLNRGETLPPLAAKLYKAWNGPAIVTKVMPLSYREKLAILSLGGEGSGNFGHVGRPGDVGGSGPGTDTTEDRVVDIADEDQPSPAAFKHEFDAAMQGSPYKAFVSHYTEEQIAGMTRIMRNDGKTGMLVHDHNDGRIEGTALYNRSTVKGAGRALLQEAIDQHGVNYCECYGGTLDTIYRDLGFATTEQYPFDDAQASPDWDYARFDRPDYHIMRLKEKTPVEKDLKADLDVAVAAGLTPLPILKAQAKAEADPAWWAQYGEESWKAALKVIGEPEETA